VGIVSNFLYRKDRDKFLSRQFFKIIFERKELTTDYIKSECIKQKVSYTQVKNFINTITVGGNGVLLGKKLSTIRKIRHDIRNDIKIPKYNQDYISFFKANLPISE